MSGQVRQWGAAAMINHITGQALPYVGSTAPSQWIPGQVWINTSAGNAVYSYDGTSPYNSTHWAAAGGLYVALLTSDPNTSGSGGTAAVNISDLVEDATSGYARQAVTFTQVTQTSADGVPETATNTAALTFGPYEANQLLPVQWAALVTAASGTVGRLIYTWILDTIEQVAVSQPIIIPAGDLELAQQ